MIIVRSVLPALRALIVKRLIEEYNLQKIDVSIKMKLTPAAVTQYIKGKRGAEFVEKVIRSKKTMKVVFELAETLAKDNVSDDIITSKLCEACKTLRSEGTCMLQQDQ